MTFTVSHDYTCMTLEYSDKMSMVREKVAWRAPEISKCGNSGQTLTKACTGKGVQVIKGSCCIHSA
jgi:hypothetical protein